MKTRNGGTFGTRFQPTGIAIFGLIFGLCPPALLGGATEEPTHGSSNGFYPGVNLASAEFGDGSKLGTNFVYPNQAEFTYFQGKGMRIVRIPFLWERVQPRPRGELDASNMAEIDRCIAQANQLDLRFSKLFRFAEKKAQINFDIYNIWNGNPVLTQNNAFASWQVPQSILDARLFRLSFQFDF